MQNSLLAFVIQGAPRIPPAPIVNGSKRMHLSDLWECFFLKLDSGSLKVLFGAGGWNGQWDDIVGPSTWQPSTFLYLGEVSLDPNQGPEACPSPETGSVEVSVGGGG